MDEKENMETENNINDEEQESNMSTFIHKGRKYYTTKAEALNARQANDRIYYSIEHKAYYIIRPKKRSFWSFI